MTASITILPDELLLEICELVAANWIPGSHGVLQQPLGGNSGVWSQGLNLDLHTLWSLCLVNRRLARIATPVLYRTVRVHYGRTEEAGLLLRTLLCSQHKASLVQNLKSEEVEYYGDRCIDLASVPFKPSETDHLDKIISELCTNDPGLRRQMMRRCRKTYGISHLFALAVISLTNLRSLRLPILAAELVQTLLNQLDSQAEGFNPIRSLQSFAVTDEYMPYDYDILLTNEVRNLSYETVPVMDSLIQLACAPSALTQFSFRSRMYSGEACPNLNIPQMLQPHVKNLIKVSIQCRIYDPTKFMRPPPEFLEPAELGIFERLEYLALPLAMLLGIGPPALRSVSEVKGHVLKSMPASLKVMIITHGHSVCDDLSDRLQELTPCIRAAFEVLIEHKPDRFTNLQKLLFAAQLWLPSSELRRDLATIEALGQGAQVEVQVRQFVGLHDQFEREADDHAFELLPEEDELE